MTYGQADRIITIDTALGHDVLLLEEMRGREALSEPFLFEATCLSQRDNIRPAELVGTAVTLTLAYGDDGDERRYFNGYIRRLIGGEALGREQRRYKLEVVPAFWFLNYTRDYRIFQHKTVPSIITDILQEMNVDKVDISGLTGTYEPRDYCVQYGESYFDFVSRLLEEEGITYYFAHGNGQHIMMLIDNFSAYRKCRRERIRYTSGGSREREFLDKWDHTYEYLTGATQVKDYNFTTPKQNLSGAAPGIVDLPGIKHYEHFSYPGGFEKRAVGEARARVRMEMEEAGHEVVRSGGNYRSLLVGGVFTLEGHDHKGETGTSWVITSIDHEARAALYQTGEISGTAYHNAFTCIPSKRTFRPPLTRTRPSIDGVQTAFVVGPSGEEIHTDEYGRIKVQFHWDRRGKADENSSCWVRTAQAWSGHNWGSMTLPRVGMEVVVSFLDGNPDRPLVTGLVNNADTMPVYALPAEKTKTTFKTRSTPGGGGFNEIRFEDKKDKEQIFVHAERDQHLRTKKELREWVGASRHLIVGGSQFEEVGKSLHATVKGDQMEKVAGNLSLDIGQDVHEKVGMNFVHKSGMNLVLEAGMSISLKVGGNFIAINPAGIFIQGTMVFVNSGGSAAGMSASPEPPVAAAAAVNAQPGAIAQPPKPPPLPTPPPHRPAVVLAQVETLKSAARSGTPFCEICAAHAASAGAGARS